jgi:hypothetical protein
VRLSIILALCYIFSNAAGNPLNRFDYVILFYILCLKNINEDTALQYAVLFGIFYDLNYQIFIGMGILIFQMLNVIKIYTYLMINMSKLYSRILFVMVGVSIYLLLTLKFCGYPSFTYWQSFAYFFLVNISAIAVISIFKGGKYVV